MTKGFSISQENAAWRIVDGEAVILNAETTYYYSLNGSGTFIWQLLLEDALTPDQIVERAAHRFGKSPGEIDADVRALLTVLQGEELIVDSPASGDSASPVSEGAAPAADYEAPALTKFDTLQQLVVSGE